MSRFAKDLAALDRAIADGRSVESNPGERTPGYNCRLAIAFTADRRGNTVAYYESRTGNGFRWFRMPLARARAAIAAGQADLIPFTGRDDLPGGGGAAVASNPIPARRARRNPEEPFSSILSQAASTAPVGTLFVMASPRGSRHGGGETVALFAFMPEGIRSRTLERGRDSPVWSWQYNYGASTPQPWGKPVPYDDGETPARRRAWHEREHDWRLVA